MVEYIFNELGYYTSKEIDNIKSKLEGTSYMHFQITSSNYGGNYTLIVRTDYECSKEELATFFLHCALGRLGA